MAVLQGWSWKLLIGQRGGGGFFATAAEAGVGVLVGCGLEVQLSCEGERSEGCGQAACGGSQKLWRMEHPEREQGGSCWGRRFVALLPDSALA